jgi:hypothetical protein
MPHDLSSFKNAMNGDGRHADNMWYFLTRQWEDDPPPYFTDSEELYLNRQSLKFIMRLMQM